VGFSAFPKQRSSNAGIVLDIWTINTGVWGAIASKNNWLWILKRGG